VDNLGGQVPGRPETGVVGFGLDQFGVDKEPVASPGNRRLAVLLVSPEVEAQDVGFESLVPQIIDDLADAVGEVLGVDPARRRGVPSGNIIRLWPLAKRSFTFSRKALVWWGGP